MYIIKTFQGDIQIDSDELVVLMQGTAAKKELILFRRGGVNPKNIVTVVEDVERKKSVVKRPGDTEESIAQRILAERSEDIFKDVRQSTNLLNTNNIQRLG